MIVKKYSDYIRYPIRMEVSHQHLKEGTENEYETHTEIETLNSMVPIWNKSKSELKDEDITSSIKKSSLTMTILSHISIQRQRVPQPTMR